MLEPILDAVNFDTLNLGTKIKLTVSSKACKTRVVPWRIAG